MNIIFSPHARKRMRERKISKQDVKSVVEQPDKKSATDRYRIIASREKLEIVYIIEDAKIIIITVYHI